MYESRSTRRARRRGSRTFNCVGAIDRQQPLLPATRVFYLPLHREDALRHDVASMAWVCRGRSSTGFICKARGRRAAGASTCDCLREAAPLARGRGGRSTLAYAPQSLFRRAREERRAVPESHAARGARPRCAGDERVPKGPPQGPRRRRTPCGRRGTPRRVAATPLSRFRRRLPRRLKFNVS